MTVLAAWRTLRLAAGLLVGFSVCAAVAGADRSTSVDAFVDAARDADIVILGEVHDNPHHHRNQAEIVASLQPTALVFEMIPTERSELVNTLRAQSATEAELAAALDWDASGWPDFRMYAPILASAPEARIFGAGQSSSDVRSAAERGAAAALGAEAARYGLDRPLADGEQAARERQMAASHCGLLPDTMLSGMVEAQRFRDAGLARAAIRALRETVGRSPVVVIAGTGHADRERGVPALVATAAPELRVLALGQFESPPRDPDMVDAFLLAPAPERSDPCDDLRPADG